MLSTHAKTFIRFAIVGVINTGIDFIGFCLFYYFLHFFLLAAHVSGFFLATANSYILNKFWSFGHRTPVKAGEVAVFLGVTVSGLVLSSVMIVLMAKLMPPVYAKIPAALVTLVWSYLGMRLLVFKKRG